MDSAEEAEILGTAAIDKIVDLAFDEIGLGKEEATTRASAKGDDDMSNFGGIVQPFTTFSDCDLRAVVDRALNSLRESPKKQQEFSRDESSEDSMTMID